MNLQRKTQLVYILNKFMLHMTGNEQTISHQIHNMDLVNIDLKHITLQLGIDSAKTTDTDISYLEICSMTNHAKS